MDTQTFNIREIKSTEEIKIGDTLVYTGKPRGTGIYPPEIGTEWKMETENDLISASIEIIERGRGWWPLSGIEKYQIYNHHGNGVDVPYWIDCSKELYENSSEKLRRIKPSPPENK